MAAPAAYLRKSKDSATKAEHLDRLLATVRRHGHNGDTVVYDDWAKSGDQRKLASRKAWRDLCAAIERGEHDVVFMNDLDRGGRSLEEWLRFIRIAQEHRVRVVAADTDYSAPENKDRLIFEAWLAERELDAAKRRAAETIRMRRRRGDVLGSPPYGYRLAKADGKVVLVEDPSRPVQPIIDAVHEAQGNTAEAVRLLNDRRVPSRFGKEWSPPALRAALRRMGELPPTLEKARRTRGRLRMPSPLSRLVICHCGQVMTPVDSRKELYCYIGSRDGAARHGKVIANQRRIFDFLEAALADVKLHPKRIAYDDEEVGKRRAALEEKRRRLGIAYADGALDDGEYDRRKEAIAHEVAALPDPQWSLRVIDWDRLAATRDKPDFQALVDWGSKMVRQLVKAIRMDEDMRPVAIEWRGTRLSRKPTSEEFTRSQALRGERLAAETTDGERA
jgi:DNA invertase Pin-like site-specific DNA recombinase